MTNRITPGVACAALSLAPLLTAANPVVFTSLYTFNNTYEQPPDISVLTIAQGVLYGATAQGGTYNQCGFTGGCGTVFSLAPPASPDGAWTETTLWNFGGNPGDASGPLGGVIVGGGGVLYGATVAGGTGTASQCETFGCGTIYALTPPASPGAPWTQSLLRNFGSQDGDGTGPWALVMGTGGVLYGVTGSGGAYGGGTVFSLAPPGSPGGPWTYSVIWNFGGSANDGSVPGTLVIGSGGVIYTITGAGGGTRGAGTLNSLTPPALPGEQWTEAVLSHFQLDELGGCGCPSGLAIGNGGKLYVTTSSSLNRGSGNGGTVVEFTPPDSPGGVWTKDVIWQVSVDHYRARYGCDLTSALFSVKTGVLYGTAGKCGGYNDGTVFMLEPPASPGGSWSPRLLHTFSGTDGSGPAGLAEGHKGLLYGGATGTAIAGQGIVYSLRP